MAKDKPDTELPPEDEDRSDRFTWDDGDIEVEEVDEDE